MAKPLEGVRILELSRVLAGPWAGQLLADMGAEVIKIERPGAGDDTRAWGPPYLKDEEGRETSEAAYYLSANRGKKSLAVDISSADGQILVRKLAAGSHIFLENFKVGGLEKYGLDYESLREINPGLVYCSITGFGQTGPYKDRPGYDYVIQAMSGLMSVTGESNGDPMKVGVAMADLATGLYAVTAILAALRQQEQTGTGCHIDMALMDVMLGLLANQNMNYLTTGQAPGRLGNSHPNIVPYQVFKTADGQMVLAAGNDRQFQAVCSIVEAPEILTDARFASNPLRVKNRVALEALLQAAFQKKSTVQWVTALVARGVPAGPINDIGQAFADPHVEAREMAFYLPHPMGGVVPQVRTPVLMDGQAMKAETPPPLLGEHSRVVLKEMGLSDGQITQLIKDGVVAN